MADDGALGASFEGPGLLETLGMLLAEHVAAEPEDCVALPTSSRSLKSLQRFSCFRRSACRSLGASGVPGEGAIDTDLLKETLEQMKKQIKLTY